MTPEREALIRKTWKSSNFKHDWNWKEHPFLNLPIKYEFDWNKKMDCTKPQEISFQYELQKGLFDGAPAYRIVCENIVLEEGYI